MIGVKITTIKNKEPPRTFASPSGGTMPCEGSCRLFYYNYIPIANSTVD